MDLKNLLPFKFQQVQAWEDLAKTYQDKIFDPNLDSFSRIRKLREVTQVDATQLQHVKELLGVPVSIDQFAETEKRRLLELITFWYEKSGTKFFLDLLRFVKNADVELFELFTNVDVTAEPLADGDGATVAFAGNLASIPLDTTLGNLTITDGTQTLTDDLAGNFTGDGTGTIDYITGAYSITFNSAPSIGTDNIVASYFSHAYQDFVKEADVTGTFTKDGGNFYLTNHVGLSFDLEVFDQSNITSLFYQIASTVLVLEVVEGVLNAINPQPLLYTGAGLIQVEEKLVTLVEHEFRNIPDYTDIIKDFIAKIGTVGLEASDEFEPALISTPDVIIPRHLYLVGSPVASTLVVGTPAAALVDSLGPSVEEANLELAVFDTLEVQEVFRSKDPLTFQSVAGNITLTQPDFVVGNSYLSSVSVGGLFAEFFEVGNISTPYVGEVTNLLLIPITPGSVVVTNGVESFSDDTLGNLTGSFGGEGGINYSTTEVVVRLNFPSPSSMTMTFTGGVVEYNTSYRPVDNDYGFVVGQSDLSDLVVGTKNLTRLHAGQIDIDHERTEPVLSAQHTDDYTFWQQNIVSGGPRVSGNWTFLPHGLDSVDGVLDIQVRHSSTSITGPFSAWESITGLNFSGRWLQFRLHYERPPASIATALITEARQQVDVRDKVESLVKQVIPSTGFTYTFDNTYFIKPSTRILPQTTSTPIIDSKDTTQVTFHLEDVNGVAVAGEVSMGVRGY